MAEPLQIQLTLPPEMSARLVAYAEEQHVPPAELALEMLNARLSPEFDYDEDVLAGLADIEAGRVVPHEKVAEWLDSWGTDHELPPPR